MSAVTTRLAAVASRVSHPCRAVRWPGSPAVLVALLLTGGPAAGGQTDYLPDNEGWNGLSELVALARGLQLPLELAQQLDWAELEAAPDTVLLWIYPQTELPTEQALRFLQGGGRLLLADDHGRAITLLRRLGIRRVEGAGVRADSFHADNPRLPIARPGAAHPLVAGIQGLVTNHPSYFRSQLPTLLGYDGGRQQVLVAGEVGQGRFVALSDPSALINNMLRFRDNLRLATNLLHHLARPGRDRLLLMTGYFRVRGEVLAADRRGITSRVASEFNAFVVRINDFALSGTGMRAMAFVLAVLAVATLMLLLPLPRRDLDGHWVRPMAGSDLRRPDGTTAAAVLREELEDRLTRLIDAPGPISALHPQWLVERVRRRAGDEAALACERLLDALRQVPYTARAEDASFIARVSRRELATIYDQSARLLQLLGSHALEPVRDDGDAPGDGHRGDRDHGQRRTGQPAAADRPSPASAAGQPEPGKRDR